MEKYNTQAGREMLIISRTCNTASALIPAIDSFLKKYSASERVLKCFKNGIKKVEILDKNGLIVGTYHRI